MSIDYATEGGSAPVRTREGSLHGFVFLPIECRVCLVARMINDSDQVYGDLSSPSYGVFAGMRGREKEEVVSKK